MTTRPAQAPAYLSALPSVFLSPKSKCIFAVFRGPAKRPTNDIRYQEGNGVGRVGRNKRQWYQLVPPDIMALPLPRVGTGELPETGQGRGPGVPALPVTGPGPGRARYWLPQQAGQQHRPLHPTLSAPALKLISPQMTQGRGPAPTPARTPDTQAQGGDLRPEPLLKTEGELWRGWGASQTPHRLTAGERASFPVGVPGWRTQLVPSGADCPSPPRLWPLPCLPPRCLPEIIHFGVCLQVFSPPMNL